MNSSVAEYPLFPAVSRKNEVETGKRSSTFSSEATHKSGNRGETGKEAGGNENGEVDLLVVENDGQLVIEERRNRQRNRRRKRAGDHVQTLYASSPRFSPTPRAAGGRAAVAELGFPGEVGVEERDADAVGTHSLAESAAVDAEAELAAFPGGAARGARGTRVARRLHARGAELRGLLAGAVGAADGIGERTGRQRRTGALDEALAVPAGGQRGGQAELGSEGLAVGVGTGLVGEDAGAVEALVWMGGEREKRHS